VAGCRDFGVGGILSRRRHGGPGVIARPHFVGGRRRRALASQHFLIVSVGHRAPLPDQAGIDELADAFYQELRDEFVAKRDKICEALEEAGLPPCPPQGAYYVLADVSRLPGNTAKEKAMHLLRETGVASVPGDAFYHNGNGTNLVRFCYAKPDAELDEACRRLSSLACSVPRTDAPPHFIAAERDRFACD